MSPAVMAVPRHLPRLHDSVLGTHAFQSEDENSIFEDSLITCRLSLASGEAWGPSLWARSEKAFIRRESHGEAWTAKATSAKEDVCMAAACNIQSDARRPSKQHSLGRNAAMAKLMALDVSPWPSCGAPGVASRAATDAFDQKVSDVPVCSRSRSKSGALQSLPEQHVPWPSKLAETPSVTPTTHASDSRGSTPSDASSKTRSPRISTIRPTAARGVDPWEIAREADERRLNRFSRTNSLNMPSPGDRKPLLPSRSVSATSRLDRRDELCMTFPSPHALRCCDQADTSTDLEELRLPHVPLEQPDNDRSSASDNTPTGMNARHARDRRKTWQGSETPSSRSVFVPAESGTQSDTCAGGSVRSGQSGGRNIGKPLSSVGKKMRKLLARVGRTIG